MAQSRNPTLKNGVQALRPSHSTTQTVSYTGTAGTISNAVNSSIVRVVCTTAAYVAIGSAPTADTGDMYVAADQPEYFRVVPGSDKVSAVQVASGGSLYVTEMD